MRIDLVNFPRVRLGHFPTPLEHLPHLSRALGGPPLYVKRDDCTGLALGGNKTRKLEFLIGDALDKGADTLVTIGGIQSNHVRQTAAAACKLGLACDILLSDLVAGSDAGYSDSGNVLLDRIFGVTIHWLSGVADLNDALEAIASRRRDEGRRPYVIPLGGAAPAGSLGYVAAVTEILQQARTAECRIDHVILASSSGGTVAGLLAGLQAAAADVEVVGICVYDEQRAHDTKVRALAAKTAELLGIQSGWENDCRLGCTGAYLGPGYGAPTPEMRDAVLLAARTEGLLLDPVYSGKAMAGLIDLVRSGAVAKSRGVLFLHTGGTPALFAYGGVLAGDVSMG